MEKLELTDKKIIGQILKRYGLRPQKKLGQNFLIDRKVLDTVVEEAYFSPSDTVVEIGAGIGVLTQELCLRTRKVISFEIDRSLGKIIKNEIGKKFLNLDLQEKDFLQSRLEVEGPFKVVANLPYQITTPVVRRFLEQEPRPEKMIVLVQKEVAERLAAKPGSAKRGWVTVLVQLFGDVKISKIVKPESFVPPPGVDSAILVIDNIKYPENIDLKKFLTTVKAGFSAKRRQLPNSLAGGLGIKLDRMRELVQEAGIEQNMRAEDLKIEEWKRLTEALETVS